MDDDTKKHLAAKSNYEEYLSLGKYISRAESKGNAKVFSRSSDVLNGITGIEAYNRKFKMGIRTCQKAHEAIHNKSTQGDYVERLVKIEKELNTLHKSDNIESKAESLRDDIGSIAEDWGDDFDLEKGLGGSTMYLDNPSYSIEPKKIYLILVELARYNAARSDVTFPNLRKIKPLKDLRDEDVIGINTKAEHEFIERDEAEDEQPDDQDYRMNVRNVSRQVKNRGFLEDAGRYSQTEPGFEENFTGYHKLRSELWREVFTPSRQQFGNNLPTPEEYQNSVDELLRGMKRADILPDNINSFASIRSGIVSSNTEAGREFAEKIEQLSTYVSLAYDSADEVVDDGSTGSGLL